MMHFLVILAQAGIPLLTQTDDEQRDSRFRGNDEFYA